AVARARVRGALLGVDGDLAAADEILAAERGLLVPGRDAEEVRGRGVRPGTVDRQQEARDLSLGVDLLQLDVGGQVADQRDAVHGSLLLRDVAPTLAAENAPNCTETAPTRGGGTCSSLGVRRS